MKARVNATRMELLRTRQRLDLAERGHHLLKDKLEGLIRELTDRLQEFKALRLRIDAEWPLVFQRFILAEAEGSLPEITETAILQAMPQVEVTSKVRRIMGVRATDIQAKVTPTGRGYSLTGTSPHLDEAMRELRELLADLVKLAGLEQAVRALADEVQKTRRRANALEYIVIPDLRGTRKDISSRIEELARSDISRLMKVKEMLLARQEDGK